MLHHAEASLHAHVLAVAAAAVRAREECMIVVEEMRLPGVFVAEVGTVMKKRGARTRSTPVQSGWAWNWAFRFAFVLVLDLVLDLV